MNDFIDSKHNIFLVFLMFNRKGFDYSSCKISSKVETRNKGRPHYNFYYLGTKIMCSIVFTIKKTDLDLLKITNYNVQSGLLCIALWKILVYHSIQSNLLVGTLYFNPLPSFIKQIY